MSEEKRVIRRPDGTVAPGSKSPGTPFTRETSLEANRIRWQQDKKEVAEEAVDELLKGKISPERAALRLKKVMAREIARRIPKASDRDLPKLVELLQKVTGTHPDQEERELRKPDPKLTASIKANAINIQWRPEDQEALESVRREDDSIEGEFLEETDAMDSDMDNGVG